jgi:hypothetical protein
VTALNVERSHQRAERNSDERGACHGRRRGRRSGGGIAGKT